MGEMIGRKSALIVSSHLISNVLAWISLVILAKMWGVFATEALGIIGFALSFISLFNIVTNLGFNSAHIKRISEGKELGGCLGTYATIKVILVSLMLLLVFCFIFIWKNVLNKEFYDATTESVIIVMLVYTALIELRYIALKTFKGTKEAAKLQITDIFLNIFKVPLTILVVLAGVSISGGSSIPPAIDWPVFLQPIQRFLADHALGSLAMTYVFGALGSFFVGLWLLRKYPWKKPSWKYFKNYFVFALPMSLMAILAVVTTNISKVIIGFYWTSIEVGYYFSMERILLFVTILSTSVSYILFPTISGYHSSKKYDAIKNKVHLSIRYISMVMVPPIILIIIFARSFISIFLSDAFLPATYVLIFLLIWAFISGITIPYSNSISGMNKPNITAIIGVSVCLTAIIFNFLLVPKDGLLSSFGINGAVGAAVATTLSVTVNFIGSGLVARKLAGIKIFQTHTPKHFLAGLIMGFLLYSIAFQTDLFPIIRWYHLFFFAALGLSVYLSVLYLLKEFKKDDFYFFFDIIDPKKMISYISDELKNKPKKP